MDLMEDTHDTHVATVDELERVAVKPLAKLQFLLCDSENLI